MKKLLTVLLMIILLAGCKTDDVETEFEVAMKNMQELDNYTYSMAFVQGSTFVINFKIDGEKSFVNPYDLGDRFEFTIDDVNYEMIERSGVYIAYAIEPTEEVRELTVLNTFEFNEEDFILDGNYYVANETIEEFIDMKIKIENGYITEILYDHDNDNATGNAVFEFSDFNTTEIILPEYTIYENQ